MIKEIDLRNSSLAAELFALQTAAYLVEAELIDFYDIPPLKETLEDLILCGETFLGYFQEEGVLAGAASYTISENELTICRMTVHPRYFRQGIARKLLRAIEESHSQISFVLVSTGADNMPAKNLYLQNGFELTEDTEAAPGFFISHFEKRMVRELDSTKSRN